MTRHILYIILLCICCNISAKPTSLFDTASDSLNQEVDSVSTSDVNTDSLSSSGDSIIVKSKYEDDIEKLAYVNRLDSISKITAPFSIKDPRYVKKGEVKYILQDRYLKQNKPFSKRIFDRVEIGLMVGYNVIHPRGSVKLKSGSPLGAFAKYNFNRFSSLRFSYTNAEYELENGKNKIKHHDFSLDFMYNVSSLLYGHNPNRFFNVSGVVGAGFIRSELNGRTGNSPKAQLGVNMDIRLSPGAHLFAEPYFAVAGDNVDLSTDNPHRWDMMYGARAGVSLRFNPKDNTSSGDSFDGSVFLDFSQGFTFFPSSDIDLMKSVGRSYRFAVGKWIDPYLGFRIGGSVQTYNSASLKSSENRSTTLVAGMAGGRIEVLVDALNLIHRDSTMTRQFGWNVSAGFEMGIIQKMVTFSSTRLRTYYTAPVISTQFLYTPPGGITLYLEPSVLFANYSIPYANRPEFRAKFSDRVFSLNVGARVSRPAGTRALHRGDIFEPRTYFGLMGGLFSSIHPINSAGDNKPQWNIGFAIGHEFTPVVAAKLQVDYQKAYAAKDFDFTVNGGIKSPTPALFNENFTFLNLKALYMLNVGNLYQGYNAYRRLNFFLEAGPTYIAVLNKEYSLYSKETVTGNEPTPIISNTKFSSGAFALLGGGLVDFRATDKLHLQFEATAQLLMKSRIYDILGTQKRYSFLLGTNIGATYDLYNPRYAERMGIQYGETEYNGKLFFDIAQGYTFCSSSDIGFFKSMGHSYRFSVGKWFDPYLGFRLSGLLHYYKWAATTATSSGSANKLTGMVGGRLEVLLNMMNLIQKENSTLRQFDWNLAMGIEMGQMRKSGAIGTSGRMKSFYAGPVFSTQLMYSPEGGVSVYLEPSLLFANYSALPSATSNIKKQFTDKVFGLNVGVRVNRPLGDMKLRSNDQFEPRTFFGLMGGLFSSIHPINSAGDNKLQWNTGFVFGHEFTPYVAAKLQIDYQKANAAKDFYYTVNGGIKSAAPALFNEDFTFLNIKAMYMLNLCNLYQGYNADRRLNFYLEGGPSYVAVLNKDYSLYSGATVTGNNPTPIISDTKKSGGAFALIGGGLIDFRATDKLHLQFEATGQLLMRSRIYTISSSAKPFAILLGTNIGATYDLYNPRYAERMGIQYGETEYNGKLFFDIAQGYTFCSSSDIGFFKSMGHSYRFSVGKWFDPYLGFRLSGLLHYYKWAATTATSSGSANKLTGMVGGRLEVLLNMMNLIQKENSTLRQFDWNLAMGIEMGQMRKSGAIGTSGRMKSFYAGPVFSTQLMYSPEGGVSVYLEPSLLFANYSALPSATSNIKKQFTDKVFGLNVGVRVNRPLGDMKLRSNDQFEPRTFFGLMGGLFSSIHPINSAGDNKLQWNTGFVFGHEFTPYVAAKLQIDYQKANAAKDFYYTVNGGIKSAAPALFNEDFTFLNIKAMYMLNLCNLYQGYNADRRLNFYLEGGPSYVAVLNKDYSLYSGATVTGNNPTPIISDTKKSGGAFALIGGGLIDFRATDKLHLQFEATGQLLMRSRIYTISSSAKPFAIFLGTNIGVTYDLYNPRNAQRMGTQYSETEYNGNLFFDVATGCTFFSSGDIGFGKSVGHSYRFSVGKWFDPYLGFRLSGLLHYYKWATTVTPAKQYMGFTIAAPRYSDKLTGMIGGRLELLLNMINLIQKENSSSRQFDWNLALGIEMGQMRKSGARSKDGRLTSFYAGPAFSTQLMYSPEGDVSVYLEPSMLFANYTAVPTMSSNIKKQFTDKVFGLNVGVRVTRPVGKRPASGSDDFEPRNFAGLSLGVLTDIHAINLTGDNKPQWSAGLVVGREFNPYVAAKLQIDYQKANACKEFTYTVADGTKYKDPSLFNENFTFLNIKALYMLNLCNLYQGFNSNRRLNFFLEGGPSYVAVLKKTYKLFSEEMPGGDNPTPIINDTEHTGGVFALCGGGLIDFKATDKLHFQFEASGQLLMRSRIYTITVNRKPYSIFLHTNIGVTYDF